MFRCYTPGKPKATYTWTHNTGRVFASSRVLLYSDGEVLEIRSVTSADVGLYQCRAENLVGSVLSTAASLSVISRSSQGIEVFGLSLLFNWFSWMVLTTPWLCIYQSAPVVDGGYNSLVVSLSTSTSGWWVHILTTNPLFLLEPRLLRHLHYSRRMANINRYWYYLWCKIATLSLTYYKSVSFNWVMLRE